VTSATTNGRDLGLRAPQLVPGPAGNAGGQAATRGEVFERRGSTPFRVRVGIDDSTVERFEAALLRYCATTTGDVVVDGSDLESIDESDFRVLVGIARRLRPLGRRLVVRGFPAPCQPPIERAGLRERLRREDGPEGPAAGD
jgi:anti-anti-sigma regulatory factor